METTFQDLGLSDGLLKSLEEAGYTHPTPIQAKAIPAVLMMRDVMGCAQTGTGKTASFTLPMIDVLAEGQGRAKMPRSLILSPTRELAAQIAENFQKYTKHHNLKMALLIGGESMKEQGEILNKGVDVLIATPGRMLDLFDRGAIILNDVKIFVIDEADRMLDMGFIPDIDTIVSKLPVNRQTLMFSATMPPEIRKLAEKFLDNPKEITVARQSSTASTVEHRVLFCGPREKRENLRSLIEQDPPESAIIFCNRKRDIGVLVRSLKKYGYNAGELHGDLPQPVRMDTLEKFKAGEITLLVCSDVAARGIDVASISHVFNYDVPNHPEDYVHRIGRTGRAGRDGKAVMFATKEDDKALAAIEKIIGKKIDVVEGHDKPADAPKPTPSKPEKSEEKTDDKPESKRGGRGRGGNRRDKKAEDDKPKAAAPINMSAWTDFVEEDVVRANDVFEGIIPAFMLRHKNTPPPAPIEELDEEAAIEEQEAGDEPKAEEKKSKPKRKRAPRRKKKAVEAEAETESGSIAEGEAKASEDAKPSADEAKPAADDAKLSADERSGASKAPAIEVVDQGDASPADQNAEAAAETPANPEPSEAPSESQSEVTSEDQSEEPKDD